MIFPVIKNAGDKCHYFNEDEHVKRHKNVSLLTKWEVYFILSTDIIKISLFVRNDN